MLAAIGLGVPSHRIRPIRTLPNVMTTLIVFVPLMLALNMLTESACPFSSIGAGARRQLGNHHPGRAGRSLHPPLVALAPGIAIVICVLPQRAWRWRARRARSTCQTANPVAHDKRADPAAVSDDLRHGGDCIVVFLIFFATPGADPASRIAGRNAAPETLAAVRHDFGLDRPLPVQYALMMEHLFISCDPHVFRQSRPTGHSRRGG